MKNTEIERKFLVNVDKMPDLSKLIYADTIQGYIQNIGSSYLYRLRQCIFHSPDGFTMGERYFQTIKGFGTKMRVEYEIELFRPQFGTLWPLCEGLTIHKYRYEVPIYDGKYHADLDVYKNEFNGLYTVEVEFNDVDECDSFIPPDWFGGEVTEKKEYSNFNMALHGPEGLKK